MLKCNTIECLELARQVLAYFSTSVHCMVEYYTISSHGIHVACNYKVVIKIKYRSQISCIEQSPRRSVVYKITVLDGCYAVAKEVLLHLYMYVIADEACNIKFI